MTTSPVHGPLPRTCLVNDAGELVRVFDPNHVGEVSRTWSEQVILPGGIVTSFPLALTGSITALLAFIDLALLCDQQWGKAAVFLTMTVLVLWSGGRHEFRRLRLLGDVDRGPVDQQHHDDLVNIASLAGVTPFLDHDVDLDAMLWEAAKNPLEARLLSGAADDAKAAALERMKVMSRLTALGEVAPQTRTTNALYRKSLAEATGDDERA